MKLQLLRNSQKAASLLMIFFSLLIYSCQKKDIRPPKTTEESADVVYAWYKFIARLQLRVNPQPVLLLNHRNFGYVGVGLYEAVRPGIKGAVSLSSRLYQMPSMPEPQTNKDYLWSATANAALGSMFKQFLTGLSVF